MQTHTCSDCGAEHERRVPTPDERIAGLEQRIAELEADIASAECARELDRITHQCCYYWPPCIVPCTLPHVQPYWRTTTITSGTVTYPSSPTVVTF